MLQTLQMLQILQTPQQPQMLQIRYRFQTVLDWLVRLVRPEWQEWPECQRRRRRPKIREACFEVVLAQLQGWERGAVLFVRPERTNATDEQKDEKGSLRRRLGRGSRMQAKDSAHVHGLNVSTTAGFQIAKRGGLPAGRRPETGSPWKRKKGFIGVMLFSDN